MTQRTLFANPREIAFLAFHADNPDVWTLFDRFAHQAVRSGRPCYSARAIMERIRWHYAVETQSPDEFKINNNHTPFYARMWLERNPAHAEFFRTRVRT